MPFSVNNIGVLDPSTGVLSVIDMEDACDFEAPIQAVGTHAQLVN